MRAYLLVGLVLLASCGDDELPDVTGTYDLSATFTTAGYERAGAVGTVRLTQYGPDESLLVSSAQLTVTAPDGTSYPLDGGLPDGEVRPSGRVVFYLPTGTFNAIWELTGEVNRRTGSMHGYHQFRSLRSAEAAEGSWTAERRP